MRLYHFTSATHGLSAIRDQQYKLSTYDNLNDPFELFAAGLPDPVVRHAFQRFKEKCAENMALLCCSKSWHSTLLWSHYADKHRGIALELEVNDSCITHVEYRKTRKPVSSNDMNKNMSSPNGSGIGADMLRLKAIDWSYEDEARVFYNLPLIKQAENGLYFRKFCPLVSLKGVILGPLCTLKPADIQAALPPSTELRVKKSRIAFRSFKVINNLSFKPRLLVGVA